MSYEVRLDEMVGKHVAEFQAELTLAKIAKSAVGKRTPMPYGYPMRVYHPHHVVRRPRVSKEPRKIPERLSNGVLWADRLQLVGQYILGVYNPRRPKGPPAVESGAWWHRVSPPAGCPAVGAD